MAYEVKIGLSNKHVHLSEEHIAILFGEGHALTPTKDLVQPGQYACDEKVDIVGPKATLKGIRVLGPARPETQVELAMTDARSIGIKAPVKESGKLEGTPGCKLVGPCGEVELDHGVMVAMRHVHLNDEQAAEAGVKDGEIVSITLGEHGETEGIFEGAVDGVIPQIIKGQTTEVDTVSGATVTSNAIIEAVEDIMNQAA